MQTILLTTLLFLSTQLISQTDTTKMSSSSSKSKKNKSIAQSEDRVMINLTMDNVINNSGDSFYNSSAFNPNAGFYIMHDFFLGKNSGFKFAPGIGVTFSKTGLDNSILVQDSSGTTFTKAKHVSEFTPANGRNYESSSFYTSWVEVPLELSYTSKPLNNGRTSIVAAVGFRAGMKLTANSKVNYYDNIIKDEQSDKRSSIQGIASFRYGATFRIGYGAFNLFGYYGLNQLIKDNKNYNNLDLRQYSVGISITGF